MKVDYVVHKYIGTNNVYELEQTGVRDDAHPAEPGPEQERSRKRQTLSILLFHLFLFRLCSTEWMR